VPALFRRRVLPLDHAFVQLSPPDRHGFCTLGTSVDASRAAVESAATVIAELNPRMPRTHGDAQVHVDEIDFAVEVDYPLPEHPAAAPTDVERAIGQHVAALVEHRDLGIHTEMFSDGLIDLVARGVVTGRFKRSHPGKIVASFLLGTRRLYDFVDDNPQVAMLDVAYVNDTSVIRRNPKVTAINSALEIDLTGQVAADSIGVRQYSGVGGQMDFIRGAALSPGGKPVIALPSLTSRGAPRIVPMLQPGAGVVTTRAHVQWVVTEHGIADLYGKNLRQRARALIAIADPRHREDLERAARERFGRVP
jgi:acyl-CoA hydrolase